MNSEELSTIAVHMLEYHAKEVIPMPDNTYETSRMHRLSQLVYLDIPPSLPLSGEISVGELADYYTKTAKGVLALERRFSSIPQELECWQTLLSTGIDDLRECKISAAINDNAPDQSGLYGCTFVQEGSPDVIAFRGSEMLGNSNHKNDYINDLSLSYSPETPQQRLAGLYVARYTTVHPGRPFAITGHSLGGNLAVYAATRTPEAALDRLTAAVSFNGPGFCDAFYKKNRDRLPLVSEKIRLYQNRYDPVSSMLINPVAPLIVDSLYTPDYSGGIGSLFYPHSNFMYKHREDGALDVLPHADKSAFCNAVALVTQMLLLIPASLRKKLEDIILAAIYDAPQDQRTSHGLAYLERTLGELYGVSTALPLLPVISRAQRAASAASSVDGFVAAVLSPKSVHDILPDTVVILHRVLLLTVQPEPA